MSSLILFINTQEARLYHLDPNGLTTQKIFLKGPKHPVETAAKNHPIHETDEERLYHTVCHKLEKVSAQEWLILGSGPGPDHFMNHLKKHHPKLSHRVLSVQKIPFLTEAQMLDRGRAFFRQIHVFQSL